MSPTSSKSLVFALVVAIIIVAIMLASKKKGSAELDTSQPVGCTMEAMICPDGSSVGRSGPNCEFAPCP